MAETEEGGVLCAADVCGSGGCCLPGLCEVRRSDGTPVPGTFECHSKTLGHARKGLCFTLPSAHPRSPGPSGPSPRDTMMWDERGKRVCHHCYKPYDVCSGECWGDRDDCAGCLGTFDCECLTSCLRCRKLFCEVCTDDAEVRDCDGCGNRMCCHPRSERGLGHISDMPGTTICARCDYAYCANCWKMTAQAECQGELCGGGTLRPCPQILRPYPQAMAPSGHALMCCHDGTTPAPWEAQGCGAFGCECTLDLCEDCGEGFPHEVAGVWPGCGHVRCGLWEERDIERCPECTEEDKGEKLVLTRRAAAAAAQMEKKPAEESAVKPRSAAATETAAIAAAAVVATAAQEEKEKVEEKEEEEEAASVTLGKRGATGSTRT